jgi:hypothetical protein
MNFDMPIEWFAFVAYSLAAVFFGLFGSLYGYDFAAFFFYSA